MPDIRGFALYMCIRDKHENVDRRAATYAQYSHSLSHAHVPPFGTFVALNAEAEPSVEQTNPVVALFALHIDEL